MYVRSSGLAWAVAYLGLQSLVAAQVWLAWSSGTLTAGQMRAAGTQLGLPLIWHLGIWSDALLLSPLLAFLVSRYAMQWSPRQLGAAAGAATMTALVLAWIWSLDPLPSAHSFDHRISGAGVAHLVYMVIALAILISFYVPGTRAAASVALGTTLLLVLHLFLGTLLALGLFKYFFGLPFFARQPLSDPLAWATFLGGTLVLAIGGYRLLDHAGPGDKTVLEKFDTVSRWVDAIALVGLIGTAFNYSTAWRHYIPGPGKIMSLEDWSQSITLFAVENELWATALSLAGLAVYVMGRGFARKNVYQLRTLFADENTPTGIRLTSWTQILVLVFGFLVLWVVIIASTRFLFFVAFLWFCFHGQALWFNGRQRQELPNYFRQPIYEPAGEHPHRQFILARRKIVTQYLLDRPHDFREKCVMAAAAVAFFLDILDRFWGVPSGSRIGYAILIAAVLLNEVVVGAWRWRLSRGLEFQNAAQFRADQARGL
jgi:hypothetical protein